MQPELAALHDLFRATVLDQRLASSALSRMATTIQPVTKLPAVLRHLRHSKTD
jgi:hypothetical protein